MKTKMGFFALAIFCFWMGATANAETFQSGPLSSVSSSSAIPCEAAPALAYLDLCERFNTENGLNRCIKAGREHYFDTCALDLCEHFSTKNGAIGCIESSRDKHYEDREMALCRRLSTESGIIECLRSAGATVNNPPNIPESEILSRIDWAIYLIDQFRTQEARQTLVDLSNWIRQNGN